MKVDETTGNITLALWQLFNAEGPRGEVSENDILEKSGCNYEQFASCLQQDADLREIMQMTGFARVMHDQTIFA